MSTLSQIDLKTFLLCLSLHPYLASTYKCNYGEDMEREMVIDFSESITFWLSLLSEVHYTEWIIPVGVTSPRTRRSHCLTFFYWLGRKKSPPSPPSDHELFLLVLVFTYVNTGCWYCQVKQSIGPIHGIDLYMTLYDKLKCVWQWPSWTTKKTV